MIAHGGFIRGMSAKRSRWDDADEEEDAAAAKKKKDKQAKKKGKSAQQQQQQQQQEQTVPTQTASTASFNGPSPSSIKPLASDDLTNYRSNNATSQAQTPPPQQRPLPRPSREFPLEPPEIRPCRSVEIYEKLNHIEEGSYGIVFRARDTETNAIVALKQLKLEKEKNGFPITGLREISTLMSARHPNIVNIREIVMGESLSQYRAPFPFGRVLEYTDAVRVYIVMDFIEHDLKALMEDMREPFLQSEIKTLMLQLLSATSLMHDLWIVHRDLKTSNLLMTNRGMIKIADFGLARYFGEPVDRMTQLVVTLWYRYFPRP